MSIELMILAVITRKVELNSIKLVRCICFIRKKDILECEYKTTLFRGKRALCENKLQLRENEVQFFNSYVSTIFQTFRLSFRCRYVSRDLVRS